jgi:hypothetical protein
MLRALRAPSKLLRQFLSPLIAAQSGAPKRSLLSPLLLSPFLFPLSSFLFPHASPFTPFTVTIGGINIYNKGVTIRLNNVELINPPIKTNANGDINGDFSRTNGIIAPIAVIDVKRIGKNLVSAPFITASFNSMPCSRN